MKAIITQKSELEINLTKFYTFDIVDDDGSVILSSQVIQCRPSEATDSIKAKVAAFESEYEQDADIEVGSEVI